MLGETAQPAGQAALMHMGELPPELCQALRDRNFERAARMECSWQLCAMALRAERACGSREPEIASKVYTQMAVALWKQGKLPDAIAILEQEAEIAKNLAGMVQDCPPAEYELLDQCLVRPNQEQTNKNRETCRNEVFDLYGIFIGSTQEITEMLDSAIRREKRKRKSQVCEKRECSLELLQSKVDAVDRVLRREARRIFIHKLREERIQISCHGDTPHPDGCWISLRGVEAFCGTEGRTPVRRAFKELMKSLVRTDSGGRNQQVRDRFTLQFEETIWSAHWKNIARFVAATSGVNVLKRFPSSEDYSRKPDSNAGLLTVELVSHDRYPSTYCASQERTLLLKCIAQNSSCVLLCGQLLDDTVQSARIAAQELAGIR